MIKEDKGAERAGRCPALNRRVTVGLSEQTGTWSGNEPSLMKKALRQRDQLIQKPWGVDEEQGDGAAEVGQVRGEE